MDASELNATARALVAPGKGILAADESTVLCITGHGLKTSEAVAGRCGSPHLIKPSLREFDEFIANETNAAAAAVIHRAGEGAG